MGACQSLNAIIMIINYAFKLIKLARTANCGLCIMPANAAANSIVFPDGQ